MLDERGTPLAKMCLDSLDTVRDLPACRIYLLHKGGLAKMLTASSNSWQSRMEDFGGPSILPALVGYDHPFRYCDSEPLVGLTTTPYSPAGLSRAVATPRNFQVGRGRERIKYPRG